MFSRKILWGYVKIKFLNRILWSATFVDDSWLKHLLPWWWFHFFPIYHPSTCIIWYFTFGNCSFTPPLIIYSFVYLCKEKLMDFNRSLFILMLICARFGQWELVRLIPVLFLICFHPYLSTSLLAGTHTEKDVLISTWTFATLALESLIFLGAPGSS